MHLSPPVAWAAVPSKAVVLLLLTFCLLLLPFWKSVIVLCFVVRYFMSILVKSYIRVGYNLDIMRRSACLVLNPITVYSFGFLFNCTTVGQASDSMTALT